MNFLSGSYDSSKNDVFVSFNQDSTSLAVSSEKGYRILSLTAIDELEEINESDAEEICMVERLFSSSLLAIVHLNTPRKLTIYHFKKGTEICNYSYSNTILAVRLNRARLVVCLEEALYIHNIRDMVVIHTIRDTPPNPTGVIALSSDSDSCFLAYPGSSTIGEVQIFDTVNLHCKTMIAAHNSPLAAMAFTANGDMIATASEKGTVMRVFKISDGTKLHEFRRGIKRCATIFGLAFSPDAAFLASTSNTETVHVFKLDDSNPSVPPMGEDGSQGWMGYLSKAVALSASYLPLPQLGVSEVLTQGRSFAVARLPEAGQRNICALAVIQKALRLLVASSEGLLYIYNIDKNSGGDCILTKQHSLIKKPVPSTEPPRSLRGGPSEAPGDSSAIDDDPGNSGSISSYAGILRGDPQGIMSESEKFREMSLATKKPEKDAFKLEDNDEFPPMSSKHD